MNISIIQQNLEADGALNKKMTFEEAVSEIKKACGVEDLVINFQYSIVNQIEFHSSRQPHDSGYMFIEEDAPKEDKQKCIIMKSMCPF